MRYAGRLYGRTRWSKNIKFIFISRESSMIAISKMFTCTFSASTVLFIWIHPLSPSTSLKLHRCCLWTPCINIVSTYRRDALNDKKLKENIVLHFCSPLPPSPTLISLLIPVSYQSVRSTTTVEIFVGLLPRIRDWNTFKYLTESSFFLFLSLPLATSLSLNPPGD